MRNPMAGLSDKDKIAMWEEESNNHFTEKDIPQYIKDEICCSVFGYKRNEMQNILYMLMRQGWGKRSFCKYNNEMHFNRNGYKKLIDYIANHRSIAPWNIEKWREEAKLRNII